MNETRLPSVALRLLGLGTALCLLFGCSPSEPVSGEVSEPVGTPVEVTTVTHGDLAAQARLSGKVAAAREVSILAPLSAKVTAVYVRVGDKVENGQVLFSLDKSDLQTSYSSLSSEYTRTKELLEAQVQQAQTNYDNTAALLEVGAASQLELDTARVTLLSAQTSMASTLQQLEDNLQTLRDTMADADVKSTMDGMVSSQSVVVGATASPTSPPAVITERGSQVTVSVSEAVQTYLSIGDTAQVIISSASEEAIEATVRTISPSAGAMTQLFDVVLDLPEDTTLTAGMFATVLVETERRENVITVPTEAILNDGVSQSVYVVEDGLASQRVLTTGLVGDGVTEVVEGLTGGEQLVVVGQSYLADGAPVRIVEAEEMMTCAVSPMER